MLKGGDYYSLAHCTMDTPSLHSTTSQRRKLVKKNPSQSYTNYTSYTTTSTTPGLDAGFDDQSPQSRRSSNSLRRAPSAPHVRSNHSRASNASSPRHSPAVHRSNPSPILPQGEFVACGGPVSPQDSRLEPLNQEPSDDLIGAPFDGAAILNRLDSSNPTSPSYNQPPHPHQRHPSVQRPRVPHPLGSFGNDSRLASPRLRSSASFSNMDPSISEKIQGGRSDRSGDSSGHGSKRYSDDGKDLKSMVMRKKSGLSGFMNSLVGSQKKPVISAPENPVHVTHVGYDSSTGQFTVCATLCAFATNSC